MNRKKHILVRILLIIISAAVIFCLSGCEQSLTGKWRSSSGQETQLAFTASGKVSMSSDGIELNGTYTDNNGQLTMVLTAPDGEVYTIYASYEISDNRLYLENSKGQIEVFER